MERKLSESGYRYRHRKELGLCVRCGEPQVKSRIGKRHCSKCDAQYRIYDKKRYYKNKVSRLDAVRKRNQIAKDEIYRRLGGYVCACCGETEKLFLTIEHKNGGGRKERTYYGGSRFLPALLARKNLDGYEILCMNCNRGKYLNGGFCPHKREEEHGEVGG